jgi:putative NADH-flavin reductase
MKLVIFGATGGTGKILVDQALALGNEVVAYIRNPSKLNIENEHLEIAQGELDNETSIERAINGADAVISVLGPHARQKGKPITIGMKNILAAMKVQGVRRLIIASTLSAKDPNDSLNFKTKAMIALVKLTMRSAYEDIVSVAETVVHLIAIGRLCA